MTRTYIRAASCISAQNTFAADGFLTDVATYTGNRLQAIEPDYKNYIDPKQARRMSHVIKMGVAAALDCVKQSGGQTPDAIITGTAFGCMEDTVTFLTRIVEMQEEMLPPTAFIQSTHNTVAAQIALLLGCHGYNNTFVHKGVSFEHALIDSLMLLNEQEASNIIVGAIDELMDSNFVILTRLGQYKRRPICNLDLFKDKSKGTIGGEGAAFFLLTDKISADNMAELKSVQTFYNVPDAAAVEKRIEKFLSAQKLTISDVDLIITGKNGDVRNDAVYETLGESIFRNKPQGVYKHLSGEYSTSAGFALWLAANCVKRQQVPTVVSDTTVQPKNILLYNHYQNFYHSLMLVTAC